MSTQRGGRSEELIRVLDPGLTIRGTYSGGRGFRLWNWLKISELEALATLRKSAPAPIGLPPGETKA